ncbi:unnamed protein product [Cuscuta epithymum]|uniref:Uncharacterized protein n=1 Tax=Cuscuta epithymum TaxID=186058 RepID=A0AAV0EBA9_9ASTE|nr:unnamed protein product [Cuscuta epithymum]
MPPAHAIAEACSLLKLTPVPGSELKPLQGTSSFTGLQQLTCNSLWVPASPPVQASGSGLCHLASKQVGYVAALPVARSHLARRRITAPLFTSSKKKIDFFQI